MKKTKICILTLLPANDGNTGVQSFFNTFATFAGTKSVEVTILNPYLWPKIIRGPLYRWSKILNCIDKEYGSLWERLVHYLLLRRLLLSWCIQEGSQQRIVFAQDPLSAKAAFAVKHSGHPFKIVLIIHYNISEAHEAEQDQLTRPGNRVYEFLVDLEKEVLPKVDRLIFVSKFMQESVVSRLPEIAQIPSWVIPNFQPTVETFAEGFGEGRDLISIGALTPRKNQKFLLEVLSQAHRIGRKYTLTVIGDGPLKMDLEAMATQRNLRAYVRFMGYLKGAGDLIRYHRMFVHSASIENCPIVLIEALAAGKPILAPAVGGIPEIFTNGVEGLFWDLNDPESAAHSLIQVMEDRALYDRMAKAARKRFDLRYSSEVIGSQWLDTVMGTYS